MKPLHHSHSFDKDWIQCSKQIILCIKKRDSFRWTVKANQTKSNQSECTITSSQQFMRAQMERMLCVDDSEFNSIRNWLMTDSHMRCNLNFFILSAGVSVPADNIVRKNL